MAEEMNINKLIDKPLNELTEEEAEFVINWKAEEEFKKLVMSEKFEQMKKEAEARYKLDMQKVEIADSTLQELKQRALTFYEQQ